MQTVVLASLITIMILMAIAATVFHRRLIVWNDRLLRKARPWLSKYLEYDEDTERPLVFIYTSSRRLEIWMVRVWVIAFVSMGIYILFCLLSK